MKEKRAVSVRLAIRAEGRNVVAYVAALDTMVGAQEIGRARMALLGGAKSPEFTQWREAMQTLMGVSLSKIGANASGWNAPTPAPERERSGSA